MNEKQQKRKNSLDKLPIVGIAATGATLANSSSVSAIDITAVNTDITSIITNTDAAADVAWPIGGAIIALTIIGYVFRRFIMG